VADREGAERFVNLKIKSETNFWSGLFFAIVGAAGIYIARGYPIGRAVSMGPGYFPTAIGIVLGASGLLMVATSFKIEDAKIERGLNLKAIAAVCAGLVLFGWGVERIGFIPSLFGLSFLSTVGGSSFNWLESLALSVAICVGSWLVFVWALELPVQLFW
jgi:hypothetical protein